ncbi:FAD-dependent oxidoreductase [Geomicrobium sediminis]|uniref:2-polyprenyl-6-methoxyphenol hydroxylase-like FAD-dependent oxidoreductase n=1 Tax=Geomicrobium sediminis TaxID=1347788 RepID=A0ABS2PDW9_9BACL|nr:NAD(P)/FAD-dependent oxidoreductase [Geomicrobium sediminis]MBM7633618.1 2-polyprenyl-6-methoxyphenol hydroxylase-like FAD-dependent oxidoreductase [Geomicrobium sediminis]
MKTTQVFVSGGGVGGLTLALKLGMCGISVVVIERNKSKSPLYKGELLQPKSIELLSKLGLGDELYDASFPIKKLHSEEWKWEGNDGYLRTKSVLSYRTLDHEFNLARMLPHETLRELLVKKIEQLPSVELIRPAKFKGFEDDVAIIDQKGEKKRIQAYYYVGAEGRSSKMRKEMGITCDEKKYDHHFLTASFPRPKTFTDGLVVGAPHTFLGLFPLPNDYVRSVYRIPPGSYREYKEQPITSYYDLHTTYVPGLKDTMTTITSWRDVQLMIPYQFQSPHYVVDNKVILGDAAHSVHPMAGEGMNLAIQDADVLSDLFCWMDEKGKWRDQKLLKWYERVRKPRVDQMIALSHRSQLAYSFHNPIFRKLRTRALIAMEERPLLHFKQMLNVSGLGYYKANLFDWFNHLDVLPTNNRSSIYPKQKRHFYTEQDDYPWRFK